MPRVAAASLPVAVEQTGLHTPVSRDAWALLGLGTLLWLAWTLWAAPAGMGIDGWIYKGPGCALAQGDGLTARYLPASISDQPLLYAVYTPGLALTFALPAWIGGCTPVTNAVFNLAVGAATAALLLPLVLAPFAGRTGRRLVVLLLLPLVPAGISALDFDRGEPLALLFLLAGLRLLAAGRPRRAPAFVAVGLAALCLPIAGPIGGLMLFATERLLLPGGRQRRFLPAAASAFAWFLLPLALWAGLWWLLDPQWHQRFLLHTAGPGAGPGGDYWLMPDPLAVLLGTLHSTYLENVVKALRSFAALAPLLLCVWACLTGRAHASRWLGVCLLLAVALLLGLAYQPYYLFLHAALAGATVLALRLPFLSPRQGRWLALLLVLAPLVGNGPGLAGDLVARSQGRADWRQVAAAAPDFVAAMKPQAPDRMLMVPATHYLLFRDLTDAVVVEHFWIPPLSGRLVGLATCALNRLADEAGLPQGPAAALDWQPWGEAQLDRQPSMFLGLRLRNRLANWSCVFWQRAPAAVPS